MTKQATDQHGEQFMIRLADEVRAEMARQRKTAADLATVLGKTQHTVGRRLNGSVPFDVIELAQVSGWLGVALNDLVFRASAEKAAA